MPRKIGANGPTRDSIVTATSGAQEPAPRNLFFACQLLTRRQIKCNLTQLSIIISPKEKYGLPQHARLILITSAESRN